MSTPMSPEARHYKATHADHADSRKRLTRKARGVLLTLLAGLACWIGAAYALAIAMGGLG
mgnify:CR=1 FL=1